jgi:hypothetical protein
MPIQFKSKLSSSVANATFLDKTIDDLKKGKLGLYKVTSSEVGAIQDVQVYINEIADVLGVAGEGDIESKDYSSTNFIENGDDRKVAIGKLDAGLYDTYNRVLTVEDDINTTQELVKEPTGFPNRTDTALSFNEASRLFTISPTASNFDVHIKGTKYNKGAESITIADTDGNHYIYYNSAGVLSETATFSPSLFENNALVSIVYWNSTNQKAAYFADERHGLVMDGATHGYLHTVFGARYLSGLGLQNFSVDGNGSLDAHAQFQADSGTIRDEDLVLTSPLTASIPVLYRSGSLWRKKTADAFPVIYNGTAGYAGTNIAYNEFTGGAWQLTEVINNNFVLIHIFATNDYQTPIIAILGTASHPNVPAARLAADSEISSISGLPFAEFVAVGSVIFKTNSAYTNTPKAAVVSASVGENYVDFRGEQLYTPSGVATSHSLLSNLSSDDHLQYFNESRGDARYVRNGASVGAGEPVFKQKSGTDLQFKTIVAGSNVTLTPGTDTLTIAATDTGEVNTASNVGTGDGVFKQKTGVNLEFKSLVAGSNVTITPGTDSITIASTDTGEVNTASNLGATGEGVFAGKVGVDLQFKKLIPGTNVTFSSNGESITINAAGGAQTMAGTITQTQKTVGTSAVRATVSGSAPSATRKKLVLKPSKNNTGSIFLGSSAVTTANGMEIIGPDRLEIELDASDYYLISDLAGQTVEILEID